MLLASVEGDCGRDDTLDDGLKPLPRNGETLPDGLVALDWFGWSSFKIAKDVFLCCLTGLILQTKTLF